MPTDVADCAVDLDHVSPHNWLNDTLWLGLAYHTWRAPLLVNSNWWLCFAADPKDPAPPVYNANPSSYTPSIPDPNPNQDRPADSQGGGDEWLASHEKVNPLISFEEAVRTEDVTPWQVRRAAWLARRCAEFRTKLQRYDIAWFPAENCFDHGCSEEILPDSSKAGPFCMSQYAKCGCQRRSGNHAHVPAEFSTSLAFPFPIPTPFP